MPYPLGEGANYEWYKIELNILTREFSSLPGNFRKEIKEKVNRPRQDLNLESPDS